MMRGRFWVMLCVLLAGGCAGTHIENTPLQLGDGNPDLRTIEPASPDRPVILMTFSGGGSRAAALAESVLRELSQTSYAAPDGPHVLTEDVKLISSVSGGSVTAAWFGLRRGPGHWDGDLDGLRSDFLTKDNMATLNSTPSTRSPGWASSPDRSPASRPRRRCSMRAFIMTPR